MKIKRQNAQKSVTKQKLTFEDHKHCSEATQLENKIKGTSKK